MWRDLFVNNPATTLAVAALFLFLAMFAAAVVWVMSRKRSGHYTHMASLPFEGDNGPGADRHDTDDRRGRGARES